MKALPYPLSTEMKESIPMSDEAINHHSADDPSLWWKQAVVYQVYPR